jgi:aspartate racemase
MVRTQYTGVPMTTSETRPNAPAASTFIAPIGIVGGMGPHAGVLLTELILDSTDATMDQQHLPSILLSYPDRIPDRTRYLSGEGADPAPAIVEIIVQLESLGVRVAGLPCNTAHAPAIFDRVLDQIRARAPRIELLHLVHETVKAISSRAPAANRIGVLATLGTYASGLYDGVLQTFDYEAVLPDPEARKSLVHRALYDPVIGIKAHPSPVHPEALKLLDRAVEHLVDRGAEAVILGCTELSIAWRGRDAGAVPVVDSTLELARALVRRTAPDRLRLAT